MIIRKIDISNFKSFENLSLEIKNINLLIGANASGKSNFIDVFRFISDIFNFGLDNAVSMQGGRDYIVNANIGFDENLIFSIEIDLDEDEVRVLIDTVLKKEKMYFFILRKMRYEVGINFLKTRKDFKINHEKYEAHGDIFDIHFSTNKEAEYVGGGSLLINRTERRADGEFECDPVDLDINFEDVFRRYRFQKEELKNIGRKRLLIQSLIMSHFTSQLIDYLKNIGIYELDPKLPKRSALITGKTELENDGSNLAIVLKKILENKDYKIKFSYLLKDILPFVEDLAIERFSDKSLIASLKETYSKEKYFPASLLSDGTISIISLIIILYFENRDFIIIEEPGNRIHPYLISKVMSMINDVSENKQIIVTTHNPELIKYTKLSNLCLIKRNGDGFSVIESVANKKYLINFLESDIGIDHLFVKNLIR